MDVSPGDAVAFRPKIKAETKPWIFVSGDNSNSTWDGFDKQKELSIGLCGSRSFAV